MRTVDIDSLLESLAKEYGIPVPNYELYEFRQLRKLRDVKFRTGTLSLFGKAWPLSLGAGFIPQGASSFLLLISRATPRGSLINKGHVVHEFFHWKHYFETGCDSKHWYKTDKDATAEEKRTESETRAYLRRTSKKRTSDWLVQSLIRRGVLRVIDADEVTSDEDWNDFILSTGSPKPPNSPDRNEAP